jgi:hypothetical protein
MLALVAAVGVTGCDGASSQTPGASSAPPGSSVPSSGTPSASAVSFGKPKPETKQADAFGAVCYGEDELTDPQRFHIQQSSDEGTDRCPGWAAAKITLGGEGLVLNGQPVVAKGALPKGNELIELAPLAKRLALYRERWKSFHPSKPFPSKIEIETSKGTDTAAVISAALTAGRSGFVHIHLDGGGSVASYRHFVPALPSLKAPVRVVYVEPLSGGGVLVGTLTPAGKLDHKTTLSAMSDLQGWLTSRCATEPCFGRVAFRPQAVPIHQTLSALQSVLSAKPLAEAPPAVSFTFGCAVAAVPTREEAVKGPWGARTPDGPCF